MLIAMRASFTILAIAAVLSLSVPAFGQSSSDVDALTKKEQAARDKAKALESERAKVRKDVSLLKKTLAKNARQTQGIETDLTALEIETATLTKRAETLTVQMEEGRTQYAELMAALQRIEASPPPSLAITPNNAKRASDAGQLMMTISEQLKKRAEALSLSLKALDVTQSQLALKKIEAKLVDEKKSAAEEADRLAAESKSLRDLIAKLESEAVKVVPRTKPGRKAAEKLVLPKGTKRFADAKGGMVQPVSGRLLYVDAGETVRRGEPVGKLPVQKGPELYIELRRNGSPVNPKPWLAAQDVKTG